jgi:hypothetical protein
LFSVVVLEVPPDTVWVPSPFTWLRTCGRRQRSRCRGC